MTGYYYLIRVLLLSSLLMTAIAIAADPAHTPTPQVGVGTRYDIPGPMQHPDAACFPLTQPNRDEADDER